MNRKHGIILIGAILIVLILAVELTAPPTNSNETKTFSNGGIRPENIFSNSCKDQRVYILQFNPVLNDSAE